MTGDTVKTFMWGYQNYLASRVAGFASSLFEALDLDVEPEVFLVGVPLDPAAAGHTIAMAPDDAPVAATAFNTLAETVAAELAASRRVRMRFSHPAIADEVEYNERQAALGHAVRTLAASEEPDTQVFTTSAFRIGDHEVVCVVRVPKSLLDAFPPVQVRWEDEVRDVSFVTSCIQEILSEAWRRMRQPHPGRMDNDILSAPEALRRAARAFLQSPFVSERIDRIGLFEALDALSLTPYEQTSGAGRILLAADPNAVPGDVLWLDQPIPLKNARWATKLLQTTSRKFALIANEREIVGLVEMTEATADAYVVEFLGHHRWELRRGDHVLMRASAGLPALPLDALKQERLSDNLARLFPDSSPTDLAEIGELIQVLARRPGGSTLVIAEDAASEADRLKNQATRIKPRRLTEALLLRAAAMDGAILMSPDGICRAIGAVLDGVAAPRLGSDRGARYNSAVRYVHDKLGRMAVVISDDGGLDVLPLLRPRLSRAVLEAELVAFETAPDDDYHAPFEALRKHAFYLDADQCRRANVAGHRFNARPPDDRLRWIVSEFVPSPEMNPEHLF